MEAQQHTPPAPNRGAEPGAAGGILDRSLTLVEFLRTHCPWDAAQTPQSLRRYLIEEAHESAAAITAGDDAALRDELGDLLLNVAFQIVVAEERGAWTREQLVGGLEQKMRRRHPHLYGDGPPRPWSEIKAEERAGRKAPASVLEEVSAGLPTLPLAQRVQERAAAVGFDWPDPEGALAKVAEETSEVRDAYSAGDPDPLEDEVGDLLFAAVNVARLVGTEADTALARAVAKFSRRFGGVERLARERGVVTESAGLETLDALWDEIKRAERDAERARNR